MPGARARRSAVPAYAASAHAPFATANTQLGYTATAIAPSRHVTSVAFEQSIIASRINEKSSNDLNAYHQTNTAMHTVAESEQRASHMRKVRGVQQQNAEWAMEYDLENKKRELQRRSVHAAQDSLLAQAMEAEEKERVAADIDRQRICAASEEIRALETQLRMATINRDRHSQLVAKQVSVAEEKEVDAEYERRVLKQREEEERRAEHERLKAIQASEVHARVLAQQMEEKSQAKVAAYEQFLMEKHIVDQVVAKLNEEDERKMERRRQQQLELQSTISKYLSDRSQWCEQEKRKAQEELARIEAYQREQDHRHQAKLASQAAKVARDDEIYAAISRELEKAKREREEMERMLEDLYAEEREQEMIREIEQQQLKTLKMREEMKRENENALALKTKRAEQARVEQDELKAKVLAQLETDRQYELLSDAKRRQAKLKLKAEIEDIIREKQRQFELKQYAEEQERQREQQRKQHEIDVIERERERMLLELATKLKDYLPKGVFRSESEWKQIMQRS